MSALRGCLVKAATKRCAQLSSSSKPSLTFSPQISVVHETHSPFDYDRSSFVPVVSARPAGPRQDQGCGLRSLSSSSSQGAAWPAAAASRCSCQQPDRPRAGFAPISARMLRRQASLCLRRWRTRSARVARVASSVVSKRRRGQRPAAEASPGQWSHVLVAATCPWPSCSDLLVRQVRGHDPDLSLSLQEAQRLRCAYTRCQQRAATPLRTAGSGFQAPGRCFCHVGSAACTCGPARAKHCGRVCAIRVLCFTQVCHSCFVSKTKLCGCPRAGFEQVCRKGLLCVCLADLAGSALLSACLLAPAPVGHEFFEAFPEPMSPPSVARGTWPQVRPGRRRRG